MHCYECLELGDARDAVGLCHHCSVALCEQHVYVVSETVTGSHPLVQRVTLPLRARLLLCGTCKAALEQPQARHAEYAGIEHKES